MISLSSKNCINGKKKEKKKKEITWFTFVMRTNLCTCTNSIV